MPGGKSKFSFFHKKQSSPAKDNAPTTKPKTEQPKKQPSKDSSKDIKAKKKADKSKKSGASSKVPETSQLDKSKGPQNAQKPAVDYDTFFQRMAGNQNEIPAEKGKVEPGGIPESEQSKVPEGSRNSPLPAEHKQSISEATFAAEVENNNIANKVYVVSSDPEDLPREEIDAETVHPGENHLESTRTNISIDPDPASKDELEMKESVSNSVPILHQVTGATLDTSLSGPKAENVNETNVNMDVITGDDPWVKQMSVQSSSITISQTSGQPTSRPRLISQDSGQEVVKCPEDVAVVELDRSYHSSSSYEVETKVYTVPTQITVHAVVHAKDESPINSVTKESVFAFQKHEEQSDGNLTNQEQDGLKLTNERQNESNLSNQKQDQPRLTNQIKDQISMANQKQGDLRLINQTEDVLITTDQKKDDLRLTNQKQDELRMTNQMKEQPQLVNERQREQRVIHQNREETRMIKQQQSVSLPSTQKQVAQIPSSEKLEEKRSMFVCSLCSNPLKNPKMLPCIHTFCHTCLTRVIDEQTQHGQFPCPVCKEEIKVPRNKVDGFPANHFLSDLQGSTPAKEIGDGKRSCDICGEDGASREAVAQCIECNEFMCEVCTKAHQRMRATSSHRVHELQSMKHTENLASNRSYQSTCQCPAHGQPITLYCTSCEAAACVRCMVASHNGHKTKDITIAAEEKRRSIQKALRVFGEQSSRLDHLMTTTQDMQRGLEDHLEQQILAIDDKQRDILHNIAKMTDNLRTQIHAKLAHALRMIKLQLDDCSSQMMTFNSTMDFANNILEHGSYRDVVLMEKELTERQGAYEARLKALTSSPVTEYVDSCKVVFITGITGDVELKHFIGDLQDESEAIAIISSIGSKKTSQKDGQMPVLLHHAETPWIPFFRRDTSAARFMSPEKVKEELFFRQAKKVMNKLTFVNLNAHMTTLLDAHMDTEVKVARLTELIVRLVSQDSRLAQLCALLCRCVSFVTVPSKSHQGEFSSVQTFLNRLCLRFFHAGQGKSLYESTTELYRTSSYRLGSSRQMSGMGAASASQPPTPDISRSRASATFNYSSLRMSGEPSPATHHRNPSADRISATNPFEREGSSFFRRTPSTNSGSSHLDRSPFKRESAGVFGGEEPTSPFGNQGSSGVTAQAGPVRTLVRRDSTVSNVSTYSVGSLFGRDPGYNIIVDEAEAKHMNLGIAALICELFKMRLITENVVHDWLQKLVKLDHDNGIECTCLVLHNVGRSIDHDNSRVVINKYFAQLGYLVFRKGATSGRITSMIKDILELRANNWEPKRSLYYWTTNI